MARSISEVELFRDDDDKIKYLSLVRKYQKLYKFKVYGYCLMDNHLHMIIDINGADISTVMHSINFSYALYYNYTHKRHGHLFQDRFKSKMIKDEKYLLALSAYVHNNPTDLEGFEACPENYEFSSLAVYLGIRQDPNELVDSSLIMGILGENFKTSRQNYMRLVNLCDDKKLKEDVEFSNEGTEYRSERKILVRNIEPEEVIQFIIGKMEITKAKLRTKCSKSVVEAKALLVFLWRSLCNYKCCDICKLLGNITQGRVSMLSSIGIRLMDEERYGNIVEEFLEFYGA
jgi:REP element-mobilizing transposase RayT